MSNTSPVTTPIHVIPACSTCRYWNRLPFAKEVGECRRLPPAVVNRTNIGKTAMAEESVTEFPKTAATVWCGEYQEK